MIKNTTDESDPNYFSFWYTVNPYTCGLIMNFVFPGQEFRFKALQAEMVPYMAAVAYKSTTEELVLLSEISSTSAPFLALEMVLSIDEDDYIRPQGLLVRGAYDEDSKVWIVAKNSIRMLKIKEKEVIKIPMPNTQHAAMFRGSYIFLGA